MYFIAVDFVFNYQKQNSAELWRSFSFSIHYANKIATSRPEIKKNIMNLREGVGSSERSSIVTCKQE